MRKTVVQSIVTFKCKGKTKKLTYNGEMSEAITLVQQQYPYHCCREGHTKFVNMYTKGEYNIIDVLSGNIERSLKDGVNFVPEYKVIIEPNTAK